jgi:hypothetical protein
MGSLYADNPTAWVHDQATVRLTQLEPNSPQARAVDAVRDALDMATTFEVPAGMGCAMARHQIDGLDDTAVMSAYRTSPQLKQQTAWAVGDCLSVVSFRHRSGQRPANCDNHSLTWAQHHTPTLGAPP